MVANQHTSYYFPGPGSDQLPLSSAVNLLKHTHTLNRFICAHRSRLKPSSARPLLSVYCYICLEERRDGALSVMAGEGIPVLKEKTRQNVRWILRNALPPPLPLPPRPSSRGYFRSGRGGRGGGLPGPLTGEGRGRC